MPSTSEIGKTNTRTSRNASNLKLGSINQGNNISIVEEYKYN